MVWIFEINQRSVRGQMRMVFGLWNVVAKGQMSATGCGAEGNEDRDLTLHEFWELARDIDDSTSVAIDSSETSLVIGGSATKVVSCL